MPHFIKLCPQCNGASPESEMLCERCGYYLGGISAIPEPPPEAAPAAEHPEPVPKSRTEQPAPSCVLECMATGRRFTVHSGDTIGQAHVTSTAQVQLSDIPGVEYISREHCRLELVHGSWFVTCLPDALNPTHLNRVFMAPGGRARIADGDELALATACFTIHLQ